ncbi:uncharacterized protein METZ01_LOCUS441491, partial [marine metagenome]
MKQKRRMWFGVVTAMILLLVITDRYDLHRSVKKWCDRTGTFMRHRAFLMLKGSITLNHVKVVC